jgi:exonuclease III
MKCLTWNQEFATARSKRGCEITARIAAIGPDVACYTEITQSMIPEGHVIESDGAHGYPHAGDKRKVVLWSRNPWADMDIVGDESLPGGRFVAGVTGGIRFVGVCIPWKMAHVANGSRDRRIWEDHLTYLAGLTNVLKRYAKAEEPICLLGDFNQAIPRFRQPPEVVLALSSAIPDFTVATSGMRDLEGKWLIDHIAGSSALQIRVEAILPKTGENGNALSDHPAVVAALSM